MRSRLIIVLVLAAAGCGSRVRQPEVPAGPSLKVMSWNVNWGGPGADLAVKAILDADADIVCLQETTGEWEAFMRRYLADRYPFMAFRSPSRRYAGGCGFLSKQRGEEVACVPSSTGWFNAFIMQFPTPIGPVQV